MPTVATQRQVDAAIARKRPLPEPAACRGLRLAAQLTLEDVAAIVGCNHATVSRWETGHRRPRGRNRVVCCALLDALKRRVL